MSAGAVTEPMVVALVTQLATNFGLAHTMEDDLARAALESSWWTILRGSRAEDVAAARDRCLAQSHRMPAIAEFRAMVNQAADVRNRAPGARSEGSCAACAGHRGYQDLGEDEGGRWFVQPCPNGCSPMTDREATRRGRARPPRPEAPDPEGAARWAAGIARLRAAIVSPEPVPEVRRYAPPPRQQQLTPAGPAAWDEEF